ncbi:carbohydrate-binding protein [Streptomyces sp. NPDC092296]|uniref:carbohydrate-binding protein n=1 Tax=Streptomyces sp. NPDC092296 TaxID=3366012 RepID=UPI0037FF915D
MTAGSNGVPEDDDPFAYLYRPAGGEGAHEGADQAAPAAVQQPGVPRTSYAHPTQVGRAQYGQQRPGQQQPAYGQTVPQQHAPYAQHSRPQPADDGGAQGGGRAAGRGGGGGSSRGVLIGAIAVVVAIAIGVGVALSNRGSGKEADTATGASQSPTATTSDSGEPTRPATTAAASGDPVSDVSALQVQNGSQASEVQGTKSGDGKYVTLQQGTSISWTVDAPSDGQFAFWVHYDNPGGDAQAAVTANGTPHPGGIGMKNYSPGSGDPAASWYSSYVWPTLKKGANTIVLTCDNDACAGLLVDKVALTPTSVKTFPG